MSHYPPIETVFPGARHREVVVSASPGGSAFNSSIAFSPVEGYALLVRDSNYTVSADHLVYETLPAENNKIRTVTHFCRLDSELNVFSMDPIYDGNVRHVEWDMVQGMEDSRLIWCEDGWHRYGTLRENHWSGQCQIGEDWLDKTEAVKRVVHPGPLGLERTEKNWQRLVGTDRWVYFHGPSQVRLADGSLETAPWEVKPEAHNFRGGSPAIPFEDGYVSIVHSVTWEPIQREYHHFLCRYDHSGFLTHFSPGFYIYRSGIAFAAGLVEWKDQFVASFGWGDQRCFFAYLPKKAVASCWIDARAW